MYKSICNPVSQLFRVELFIFSNSHFASLSAIISSLPKLLPNLSLFASALMLSSKARTWLLSTRFVVLLDIFKFKRAISGSILSRYSVIRASVSSNRNGFHTAFAKTRSPFFDPVARQILNSLPKSIVHGSLLTSIGVIENSKNTQ